MKRAAVKFGIGRYLYRLPAQWLPFDGKRFLTQPSFTDRLAANDAAMAKAGLCAAGDCVRHVQSQAQGKSQEDQLATARAFEKLCRQAKAA